LAPEKQEHPLHRIAVVTPKKKKHQSKANPVNAAVPCAYDPLAPCELVLEEGKSSQGVAWPERPRAKEEKKTPA